MDNPKFLTKMHNELLHALHSTMIHITRDSVDGAGCAALLPLYLNEILCRNDTNVVQVTTRNRLGVIYDFLDAYQEAQMFHKSEPLNFLLTACGEFDIDYIKSLSGQSNQEINIFIIDNHQSRYMSDRRAFVGMTTKFYTDTFVKMRTVYNNITVWEYINYKMSSTEMLYQLLDASHTINSPLPGILSEMAVNRKFDSRIFNNSGEFSIGILLLGAWMNFRRIPEESLLCVNYSFRNILYQLFKKSVISQTEIDAILSTQGILSTVDIVHKTCRNIINEYSIWTTKIFKPGIFQEKLYVDGSGPLVPPFPIPWIISQDQIRVVCTKLPNDPIIEQSTLMNTRFNLFANWYLIENPDVELIIQLTPCSPNNYVFHTMRSEGSNIDLNEILYSQTMRSGEYIISDHWHSTTTEYMTGEINFIDK